MTRHSEAIIRSSSKSKTVIALTILGVLLFGGFVVAVGYTKTSAPKEPTTSQQPEPTRGQPAPAAQQSSAGHYIDYSDDVISSHRGTKLLFFHATWCAQCRALDKDLKSSVIPSGVTIIKVDYDSHDDLRRKYGVTLQTTVVKVDDAGNKVDSFVAYDSPTLQSIKEELL